MEKVRPWCDQPSDRGRLRNRNRNRVVNDRCVGSSLTFVRKIPIPLSFPSSGADLVFYKGGCPIHLKGAPEKNFPPPPIISIHVTGTKQFFLALEEVVGARRSYDIQNTKQELQELSKGFDIALRYDTRCYFNVRAKADISQLYNLPHVEIEFFGAFQP